MVPLVAFAYQFIATVDAATARERRAAAYTLADLLASTVAVRPQRHSDGFKNPSRTIRVWKAACAVVR